MSTGDPPRLSDASGGAPARLRALIEAGAGDLPSAADLARVEAKLGPLLAPPAAAPGPVAASSGVLAKAGLAVLGGALVAGGLWLVSARAPARAPIEAPAPGPAPMSQEAPPPTASPGPEAPPPIAPAPSVIAEEPAAPKAAASPRPAAVPEDVLLEQARRALGSDPRRALSLAREHELGHPGGVLAQEREVIAIEALRRLGRSDEAARRLERFERRYPESAHRRKLEQPAK